MPEVTALNRILAQSFNRSIIIALQNPPDAKASAARIQRIINSLPKGKLYSSNHGSNVSFYTMQDGHQKYMSQRSNNTHALARKSYLMLLQEILELTASDRPADILRRDTLIAKLQKLILSFERGNLNLARIVLTSEQYKWFTRSFVQKKIDPSKAHQAACGLFVRSNSEKEIINTSEDLALPLHYEEKQTIYVFPLVQKLRDELVSEGFLREDAKVEQLFDFRKGITTWNVPSEFQWMNTHGSIWKSYFPPKGTIVIYNDFKIMLADGTIFIWEHEGLMDFFIYRCNATERITVMKTTHTVDKENILETYQDQVDSPEKLIAVITKYILPRLWF